jgi:hypothetical protein
MKQLVVLCILSLVFAVGAWGTVIPNFVSVTPIGGGLYQWEYQFELANDQTAVSGAQPPGGMVNGANFASFTTIYDFYGYVSCSSNNPVAGCAPHLLGSTPIGVDLVDPPFKVDDPYLTNVTWWYLAGNPAPIVGPQDLGRFYVVTTSNEKSIVSYTTSGTYSGTDPNLQGSPVANGGLTTGGSVPEPVTLALTGIGLLALGLIRRRARIVR